MSTRQLGAITVASAVATALVIAGASERSPVESAVLAALARPPAPALTAPAPASTPATPSDAATPSDPAPATAADSSPVATDTPSPASTPDPVSAPATPKTPAPAPPGSVTPAGPARSKVGHVFVIALASTGFDAVFGAHSSATYLNRSLRPRGTLLSRYETLGSADLPDLLALASGQAPNADTAADCTTFAEFPGTAAPAANGLVPGDGCVYPNTALTVGDQLTSSGRRWGAYIESMGAGRPSPNCEHPDSGAPDPLTVPSVAPYGPPSTPAYATHRNPFVYFHSLLDLGDCMTDDKPLTALRGDLRSPARTPALAYIAAGPCDDGAPAACPGSPGGPAGADAFLRTWVPAILASPAYRRDGALAILFTTTGPASATTPSRPVRTGALVLSRYAHRGATVTAAANPYAVLRTIEDLLGLRALGRARSARSLRGSLLPAT